MSNLTEYHEEIRRLYVDEGLSDAKVAAALPIETSGQAVYRFRRKVGIEGHGPGRTSPLEPHREEIVRLYTSGEASDDSLAERYGVSSEAVRQARKRWGVETVRRKNSGRYSTDALFEEVKDQLPEAWERSKRWHKIQKRMVGSSARVGAEYGVSPATAQRWMKRLGLLEERPDNESGADRVVDLLASGWSVRRISEDLGVSGDTVRAWAKKRGIDLSSEHYTKRMTHEEKAEWRRTLSRAKGFRATPPGQYSYGGETWDSTPEVLFVEHCDRVGLPWTKFDRTDALDFEDEAGGSVYAPDVLVGDLPVEIKGYYGVRDARRVKRWRAERGPLALVSDRFLLDFESTKTAAEAERFLRAQRYFDPDPRDDLWRR